MVILGISAFYHDSAAVLIIDGTIVAAAQEERFTRIKHDPSFPLEAIRYVLFEAGITLAEVNSIAFYDKPFLKFERLLETYHAFAPAGLRSFLKAIPVWIKDKLFMKRLIRNALKPLGKGTIPILFTEHHLAHAASAFYPSPYSEAAILTVDGVGEWATTSIGKGSGNTIEFLKELHFPHSLGLLYSAFTFYLGFKVNSGEYKVMGLAPYGNPEDVQTQRFIEQIKKELIDIREDGSFLLNMAYFRFASDLQMTDDLKWRQLFSLPRRMPESELTQPYMNLAYAIQQVTEEVMIKLAQTAKSLTGSKHLVLAGGVALNCVANSKLYSVFDHIWIQPAAGDAGGALGAALAVYYLENDACIRAETDAMQGACLGPSFSDRSIQWRMQQMGFVFQKEPDTQSLLAFTANQLQKGSIVGWFQGRMEFGPRALGNRSILADAGNPIMQQRLNQRIKFRENFRPFAPCVREEDVEPFFEWSGPAPYMLFTAPVKKSIRKAIIYEDNHWQTRLEQVRSTIPAVTHLDYSARIQTVNTTTNPLLHQLLTAFKNAGGSGVLVNTSFNVRGEPIVCTPEDALRCFAQTDMDVLVIGNFILEKSHQSKEVLDRYSVRFKKLD
ncbi:MAG: carbamoyltransferase [Siphonobacter sp.]